MTQTQFLLFIVIALFIASRWFRGLFAWVVFAFLFLFFYVGLSNSEEVNIEGKTNGSGDGRYNVLHIPQYMPYYPTAATIWPRTIDVKCKDYDGNLDCEGYNWSPSMGRTEYLFINPVVENQKIEEPPEITANSFVEQVKPIVLKPKKRVRKSYKPAATCVVK